MAAYARSIGFHDSAVAAFWGPAGPIGPVAANGFLSQYTFTNFFHPLVGQLLGQLNRKSLSGIFDPIWQSDQRQYFFGPSYHPSHDDGVRVTSSPEQFDVINEPYANYNWELFFHIPLTIAVHLSKNQRFAEAQRWFHYIFNPTAADIDDTRSIGYAAVGTDEFHLCAVTTNGRFWHTIHHGDGTWPDPLKDITADLGDVGPLSTVACAADTGQLRVCIVTATGGLYHASRSTIDMWQRDNVKELAGDPGIIAAASCATSNNNDLHICMVMADGGLTHTIRFADGHWQNPFGNVKGHIGDQGFVTACACAAGSNNDVHVCIVTRDGGLYHTIRYGDDGHWENPSENLQDRISGLGSVTSVACAPGQNDDLHVCVVTADGGLTHVVRAADGSWLTPPSNIKKEAGDPGIVKFAACTAGPNHDLNVCAITETSGVTHTVRAQTGQWRPLKRGARYRRDQSRQYWNFLAFRQDGPRQTIDSLLQLLSRAPDELSAKEKQLRDEVLNGYTAILNKPFQPHAVARTRHLAYQYCVVMKYLDNLLAWGDQLFQQDTLESINEASQRYVLAANLLGPRPQRIPPRGVVRTQTFAQLKNRPLDALSNALVELEGQFPFNLDPGPSTPPGDGGAPLFGIGRTLYFCVPRNNKLLAYWDTVADRLFKIRNCMNIAGIARPLALFDPPIDPAMLVRAAAAGIDVGGIVDSLNPPVGPIRCATLIQKALELCNEVRSLGAALLSALEKGDAEHIATIRQRHEINLHQMTQGVRFLQWKSTQEQTQSLLTTRGTTLERLHYYARLLGLPTDPNAVETLILQRPELTEENFDDVYAGLVTQYDKPVARQSFPTSTRPASASPAAQAGAAGQGRLYLTGNEDTELNTLLPQARDTRRDAAIAEVIATILTFIPEFNIELAFWGLGGSSKLFGGAKLSDAIKIGAEIARTNATWATDQAGIAARTAGYERRADDWLLQYNLAAHELMQNGRQILTSLIAEQVAHHEYLNVQQQITNAQEIDRFLHEKISNEELYLWMQGELSRLYYEYYRFAVDTARKAERTMKQEIMRPEVDAQTFVKFNYWDGGRKGLLSGEALHLDVKRMEVAYLENNRRELELTRHISLRQLNPVALLKLKATGSCVVNIPEWLYDRDCPGHYLRRIKSIALSTPSVVGPYTSLNCTLALLHSSIRTSAIAGENYLRQGPEDSRFTDYTGGGEIIVTSSANFDTGMFEINLRDERFLPFERAGAISTWKIDLPNDYRSFDYMTISDLILHIRYTARPGIDPTKVKAALDAVLQQAAEGDQWLLFSLPHDFPSEWSAFVNEPTVENFTADVQRDYFPYTVQDRPIEIADLALCRIDKRGTFTYRSNVDPAVLKKATDDLASAKEEFTFNAGGGEALTRTADGETFLVIQYRT